MKRSDMDYLEVVACILNDIKLLIPDTANDLDRDFTRLSRIVKTRGYDILFLDFPECLKVLDKGLSSGYLNFRAIPKSFGTTREGWPKLFGHLFTKLFDDQGTLSEDVNLDIVFYTRQLLAVFKKINLECTKDATLEAVQDFVKIEDHLPAPSGSWHGWCGHTNGVSRPSMFDIFPGGDLDCPGKYVSVSRRLIKYFQFCADYVSASIGDLDYRDLVPRHGPGAVSDARTGDDKFIFPFWPSRLEEFFPQAYFGQHSEDALYQDSSPDEHPAKLIAVPKTLKGPRLIASEPTALQYCQQSLLTFLRLRLPEALRQCVSFSSQEPSRELCLEASRTGSHATVDLSSASDRLSLWLVERFFRRNPKLLEAFNCSRSIYLSDGTDSGCFKLIRMKKLAAQGCAFTFPVQTIIYATAAIAVVMYNRGSKLRSSSVFRAAREVRVFGDDIILPSPYVSDLAHLLSEMFLKVNGSKTHSEGYFREACGMDAFKGYDVTPVYVRSVSLASTPESLSSFVDVRNNAYSRGLFSLAKLMDRYIDEGYGNLIPFSHDDMSCLRRVTFLKPSGRPSRWRFNRSLHRFEVLAICVKSHTRKTPRHAWPSLLQYFLEDPSPDLSWSSGVVRQSASALRTRWVPTNL